MIKVQGRVISVIQNNSGTLTFVFYDAENKSVELSDYTVTFMVKKSKTDADSKAIITKTYDDISGNALELSLLEEDTAAKVGYYWWSILLTSGTYKNEVISGQFYIIDGVQD